jgi:hypothetical protein
MKAVAEEPLPRAGDPQAGMAGSKCPERDDLPARVSVVDGSVGGESAQVRCTAPDALSNLVAVLELVADRRIACSATSRRPSAATVRLVEDALVAGDYYDDKQPIAAYAWPLLVQVSGLAQLAGTRLELSRSGEQALASPSYKFLATVWARWLKNVSHDELARIEAIKGQHKPATLTSAVKRRAAVAAALALLEPGTWADADMVLRILQTDDAPLNMIRGMLALWRLYIGDSYYGALGHGDAKALEIVEARYALCVLFEYAATMGLIDIRYADPGGARPDYRFLWGADMLPYLSRYDGLLSVRVNDLGAALLHDPAATPYLHLALPTPRR